MDTPSTLNPLSLLARSISMNQGISILHGPHQVAKKSNSTTFPLYSSRCTVLPSASFSANSGAGLRSETGLTGGADLAVRESGEQPVKRHAATSAAARAVRRRGADTDWFPPDSIISTKSGFSELPRTRSAGRGTIVR